MFHSFIYSFIPRFIYFIIHSFINPFIHPFIHSLIHSFLFTHCQQSTMFCSCITFVSFSIFQIFVFRENACLLVGDVYYSLYCPAYTFAFSTHSFDIVAPTIWNSLPSSICPSQTLNSFSSHLRTHFFQSALTTSSDTPSTFHLSTLMNMVLYKCVYLLSSSFVRRDIDSTTGKIRRALLQFTPQRSDTWFSI